MKVKMRTWVSALAFAALMATPAQAVPCWKSEDIGAARVRQFEVLLMIVSLRCKDSGLDIQSNYERFRTAQRTVITANEGKLRARYGADRSKAGKLDYESYMTKLGNHYGAGNSDANSCQMFGMVMDELAKTPANPDMLSAFAFEMVRDPIIDSSRCPVSASSSAAKQ
jgi:hypothetical protein